MGPGILDSFVTIREVDTERTLTRAALRIAASGRRTYKTDMALNSGGTVRSSRVSSGLVRRMVGVDSLGGTIALMKVSSLEMTYMGKDPTLGQMVDGILASGYAIRWDPLEPWVGPMVVHTRVNFRRVENMAVERIVGQMEDPILVNGGRGANMERALLKLPEVKSAGEFGRMVSSWSGLMVVLQLWKTTYWASKGTLQGTLKRV